MVVPEPVGVGVSGDRGDRDDGGLGDISTAGGRGVRGVDCAVSLDVGDSGAWGAPGICILRVGRDC